MPSTAVASPLTVRPLRDPVLLAPVVVGAGLAVGWLGADAGIAGGRVAVDLALSWALVAASLVTLERARWRRSRVLLAGAAFALLGADLRWASSDALWTVGFLLQGLWAALLVHLVLTFPAGRPWSRAARVTIIAAYVVTLGGQLIAAVVHPDARDVLSLSPHVAAADDVARAQGVLGVAIALSVLYQVARRLLALRGTARRAQGPLLAAAALTVPTTIVWLIWVTATGADAPTLETIARAASLLVPLGVTGGIVWSRLHRPQASDLVVELRTEGSTSMRERLARALGDPTLDVAYRLDDGLYVDAAGQPLELPEGPHRAVTLVTARGEVIAALVRRRRASSRRALARAARACFWSPPFAARRRCRKPADDAAATRRSHR